MRRYLLPSTSALTAFEAAARSCNFSRAAEELNTSQSAISRHISELEARYNTQLFIRAGRHLSLSEEGLHLHRAIHSGFDGIQAALHTVRNGFGANQVTIACSHEISHLYVMPRHEALQSHLGDGIQIRLMTYEYDVMQAGLDPRIDMIFAYATPQDLAKDSPSGIAIEDAVTPICSPDFFARNKDQILAGPAQWKGLPFLNLTKQNQGWATWQDWFQGTKTPAHLVPDRADMLKFDNYVYLLEACAMGRGIALGWFGLTDRYLAEHRIQTIHPLRFKSDRALYALLTPRGQNHEQARTAHDFLIHFKPDEADGVEAGIRDNHMPPATIKTEP